MATLDEAKPAATQPSTEPERTIGRPGEPVRALVFSSGGFDTAMQLGVAHALLVSRAPPPDVVLGISAGAVNAVALAEILQAGSAAASPDVRLCAKVERFRQIFENYQNCPGDVVDAMLPDTYEIDTTRPLKPLRLPVHEEREREFRNEALGSRSGFVSLYNELMRLPLSIGAVTRALRRVLGLQAAGDMPRGKKVPAKVLEGFRFWMLAGEKLHQLAPLLRPLTRALLLRRPAAASRVREEGVSAAQLIFRSRMWVSLRLRLTTALSALLLLVPWLLISIPILVLIAGIGGIPLALLPGFRDAIGRIPALVQGGWIRLEAWPAVPSLADGAWAALAAAGGAVAAGAAALALALSSRWDLERFNTFRVILRFALVVVAWTVVFAAACVALALMLSLLAWVGFRAAGSPDAARSFGPWLGAGILAAIALALIGGIIVRRATIPVNLLAIYHLADSLLNPHPLRQFFVRIFDPGYYGQVDMDAVVNRAIQRDERAAEQPGGNKTVGDYANRSPPIHVALAVADLSTGKLDVVDEGVLVVDGLLAATAVTPLFPPVPLGGKLCIDSSNVATEATQALLDFLRPRVREDATAVHIYSVAPLPLSRPELTPRPTDSGAVDGEYTDLVHVAARALNLQRFRDARLDQTLTHVFSRSLPGTGILHTVASQEIAGSQGTDGTPAEPRQDVYLRAWIYPVEPTEPLEVNSRLAEAPSARDRRRIVAETVADGCRAAMQNMLGTEAAQTATSLGVTDGRVLCAEVLAAHRKSRGDSQEFPGSVGGDAGPGLTEVCEHCALHRPATKDDLRRIVAPAPGSAPPDWGRESGASGPLGSDSSAQKRIENRLRLWGDQRTRESKPWPRQGRPRPGESEGRAGNERPTVSLLFSGGVFRGVYQMGVLNALNVAGVRPDVIAGASIGSITAAMVARVFREEDPAERQARITRLAATYLTLDRLVLTDRFADFVRVLTIRAASTRFSLRQADRVFRIYDEAPPGVFEREARAVVAGIERLFYLSPFELRALVEAMRRQQFSEVGGLLRTYLQEWLVRMGVGNQVLGAEPLALLIAEHVLEGLPGYVRERPGLVPFQSFVDDGIYFLATTTNLTRGGLEILGEDPSPEASRQATLLEGLLASSAFPGVFRPRWSWEVMPAARNADQYIDGGVTDNLPLDAVAQFLYRASNAGLIDPRPEGGKVPHLLLCASLEPRYEPLSERSQVALRDNWPALWRHARELRYNKKVDLYGEIQRSIRRIVNSASSAGPWQPLDLEVMVVKPEWLCSTFAFHPMLGFRRSRQAQSIAHGCASTLIELGRRRVGVNADLWPAAWDIDASRAATRETAEQADPYVPENHGPNNCWFVKGVRCPFSRAAVAEVGLPEATARELVTIYEACGKHETHRPPRPREA